MCQGTVTTQQLNAVVDPIRGSTKRKTTNFGCSKQTSVAQNKLRLLKTIDCG